MDDLLQYIFKGTGATEMLKELSSALRKSEKIHGTY